MADTLSSSISRQALMESEACSNLWALHLWAVASGTRIPPCDAYGSDSVLQLIQGFAGRADIPAHLLAGLLLAADLRPDDRLWVEGASPVWLPQALSLIAGRAASYEAAHVLVTDAWPAILLPTVRRIILTGDGAGQGEAPPGVTVSLSKDWS
ncbi:hypothetical protein ACELLULO517_15555 [Acidisoma cellulosilytica]|uniref:Uncharacterized protein n=1 Tax=Acidisoma cellulosilyticum TaxID=2802395 RepID=A0A963Z375_9PROT|nr:hypothetical protein [Acidisoma cellulosilyticum]MCB8881664.1 hypothetical protein [Acidisoma cellulosilyticum]